MATHLVCPTCHFPFVLSEELAGKVFECAQCGTEIEVPAAPSPPLPPLEYTDQYHRVVGDQTPGALELIGLEGGGQPSDETFGSGVRFVWGLRHLFLMLVVLGLCGYVLHSREIAQGTGPLFLGAGLAALVGGYALAVHIAEVRDPVPEDAGAYRFYRFLLNPIVLVLSDFRGAMPVYRAFVYGGVVLTASLMVGMRAGSLEYLLPASPWKVETASAETTAPRKARVVAAPATVPAHESKMVFMWDKPAATTQAAVGAVADQAPPPPPEAASKEEASPKVARGYRPEDGPPPPPAVDQ